MYYTTGHLSLRPNNHSAIYITICMTIYMYTTLDIETINMLDKSWDDTTPDYPTSNNGSFRKRTLARYLPAPLVGANVGRYVRIPKVDDF